MTEVSINKQARLSEHFTLGELCKTSAKTQDGRSAQGDALLAKNIPSHVHIENLKRLAAATGSTSPSGHQAIAGK